MFENIKVLNFSIKKILEIPVASGLGCAIVVASICATTKMSLSNTLL